MASERQKAWARRVAWIKKISIVLSLVLVAWAIYALITYKPAKIEPLRESPSAPPSTNG